MRPPKEKIHHSLRRERLDDASKPLVLGSRRRGRARGKDEKRRVRENRKEMEGSIMSL